MPSSGVKTCARSEEHTSELQSHDNLVCRLLLEKKNLTPRAVLAATSRGTAQGGRVALGVWACRETGGLGAVREAHTASPDQALSFFFFNNPPPPEFSPFPLHDPLPI